MLAKTKMTMPTSKPLFYEFTTRKKYWVPSQNFGKKMFCAKKVTKLPDLAVLIPCFAQKKTFSNANTK